jgi:hypothetical protein
MGFVATPMDHSYTEALMDTIPIILEWINNALGYILGFMALVIFARMVKGTR